MKKICVVTGTRAEYGLLYWLMKDIQRSKHLKLNLIVTGMHVSTEFGLTYKQIIEDGFKIDRKVEMILSADTPSSISKSVGLGIISFADVFSELNPDLVIVLGDRYELLAAATASLISKIPIGHIHGGETTIGAFDEAIRHSITKMSWWHFVAAEEYKKRVIQLGENPNRVFLVGGLGVDAISRTKLLNKKALESAINFKFNKKNLMVTYHPVTLEQNTTEEDFNQLIGALENLKNTNIIFTYSNSDTHGRIINEAINKYIAKNKSNSKAFTSMGNLLYLSSLKYVDAVVGNSSSGLLEAPTLKIATINIGDRQGGRLKSDSVIDCKPDKESILNSLKIIYSKKFKTILERSRNPYGKGKASEKIIKILSENSVPNDTKKVFFDI